MNPGPIVVRRTLGRRLANLRKASQMTARAVAQAIQISSPKLSRIEAGEVPIKKPDVWALCRVYGVDRAAADALAAMCVGTTAPGWWEEYGDAVPEWFQLYVDLESAAAQISCYTVEFVPSELQTNDYARALYRAACPDDTPPELERRVRFREERRRVLAAKTPPPELVMILGEEALRRRVGGAAVMRAQLDHLRDQAAQQNIDIRVLPSRAGAHPAFGGPFRILDFVDPDDPPVVYLQEQRGAHYRDKPEDVEAYRRVWKSTYALSVPLLTHLK